MGIDLYYTSGSPPCRAVLLTANALNLDLNLKTVDMSKGEHRTPEFLKLNPQHTIPTIVDEGFPLFESRAIIAYLANKYGKGGSLYPAEPEARAIVDLRLYFDAGTLSPNMSAYLHPIFRGAPADPEKKAKVDDVLKILDTILEGEKFVAGPNLTIADLSLISSVTTIEVAGFDFTNYKNINKWIDTVKAVVPGYQDANQKGLDAFKVYLSKFLK